MLVELILAARTERGKPTFSSCRVWLFSHHLWHVFWIFQSITGVSLTSVTVIVVDAEHTDVTDGDNC